MLKRKPKQEPAKHLPDAVTTAVAAEAHGVQLGSTAERDAIKDKLKRELARIEREVAAGAVLPDPRLVLRELIEFISGREKRTDEKPGGL